MLEKQCQQYLPFNVEATFCLHKSSEVTNPGWRGVIKMGQKVYSLKKTLGNVQNEEKQRVAQIDKEKNTKS